MTHARHAGMLAVVAALAVAAPASAGMLSDLHYGITGGGMIPVARQGRDLRRGSHFGAQVFGESNVGLQVGAEGSYTLSSDALKTRISHVGLLARLSPSPEDYRLYVQMGAGAYGVGYHGSTATPKPESWVRPGGSFAVGAEVVEIGNITIGGSFAYHGIVVEQHRAVSFSTIRLHVTYRHLSL